MAFPFRIYFSGLCVFVPDQLEEPTFYDVLLLNLMLPRQLRRPKPGEEGKPDPEREILDPHFPLMIFNDPGPQGRAGDFRSRLNVGDHGDRGVCLLLHDDLEILPDGAPVSAKIDVSSSGEQALSNIVTVEQIAPGHGRIDPVLLTADLTPKERVVARIRGLSGGKLSVFDLSEEDVKIEPILPGTTFTPRPIAVRLAWEIECQSHMALRWRQYDTDNEVTVEKGDLRWDPKPDNSLISIWIENREIDAFIGVPSDYPVTRALADFEVFFGLSAQSITFDPPATIPIPLSGAGGPQFGSLHGGKCPPTVMLRS